MNKILEIMDASKLEAFSINSIVLIAQRKRFEPNVGPIKAPLIQSRGNYGTQEKAQRK